jgi:hypothetical protein
LGDQIAIRQTSRSRGVEEILSVVGCGTEKTIQDEQTVIFSKVSGNVSIASEKWVAGRGATRRYAYTRIYNLGFYGNSAALGESLDIPLGRARKPNLI